MSNKIFLPSDFLVCLVPIMPGMDLDSQPLDFLDTSLSSHTLPTPHPPTCPFLVLEKNMGPHNFLAQ